VKMLKKMTQSADMEIAEEVLPRVAAAKILTLEELGRRCDMLRAQGEKIVLCHGVFDLLHLGHVRYLEAARAEGTILVVTLTDDPFVNKGPDRPVFTAQLRAEMLASMECVDCVAVNHAPTAVNVIDAIKPHVYAKGSDYADASQDITGRILDEAKAVEAHGGKLVFTNEITFSSSTLLNRHMGVYDTNVREYLSNFRERYSFDTILETFRGIENKRVLMVGEAIIDEYDYVAPQGRAAKENIIVTRFIDKDVFAGGVIAAANHVASFCKEVSVLTILGEHSSYEAEIRKALKPNVTLHIVRRRGAPTTRKLRYVEDAYKRKLFEVYVIDDLPLPVEEQNEVCEAIAALAPAHDTVVVTDFGHGMLTDRTVNMLMDASQFLAVNAQTNSGNYGFNLITKYTKADYICIDGPEARLAVHDRHSSIANIVSEKLPQLIDCPRMVLTQGKDGCTAYDRSGVLAQVPAFTRQIVDTVGAGDAFFAITAPLVANNVPMDLVGAIGNAAGAVKVGILGHRSAVEKVTLLKYLNTLLK